MFLREINSEEEKKSMKNLRLKLNDQRGFNLIELMIVIAIIALLIGIGVPTWQSMVRNGNETSAIQSLNTIRTLQTQYASKNKGKFAANFDELISTVQLSDEFKGENPVVNGYIFTMTVQESSGSQPSFYSVKANPQVSEGIQATGTRFFYTDSTLGSIRYSEGEEAKADSSSI
jgi:prepilin-type N-terminal cleavage/methylation domain-containing protein